LYSKTANKLVPITAIEVNYNYNSVDATINLSNFTSVNKDFIINQLTSNKDETEEGIYEVNFLPASEEQGFDLYGNNEDNNIRDFASVEVMPEFPGGQSGWGEYLQQNMRYPPIARENNISGRVILSFVVEKNGDLSDIRVLRGIGGGCDEEAVRVLKTAPSWKPGKLNDRPVRVAYTMPIFFQLAAK
jgi:TonB family protein